MNPLSLLHNANAAAPPPHPLLHHHHNHRGKPTTVSVSFPHRHRFRCCSIEIDMVRDNKTGSYAPKQNKVVVLWDLDNKPPRGPPYHAAVSLKTLAESFGDVVDISAYANRHAFIHLPQWVLYERRQRKTTDILEKKGIVAPSEPYICSVCGRKCKTNLDLKKHFKQLHQRERQKKLNIYDDIFHKVLLCFSFLLQQLLLL